MEWSCVSEDEKRNLAPNAKPSITLPYIEPSHTQPVFLHEVLRNATYSSQFTVNGGQCQYLAGAFEAIGAILPLIAEDRQVIEPFGSGFTQ